MPSNLQFTRASIKTDTIDRGFSDVWYTTGQLGDELTAPQAYAHVGIVRRPVDLLANAVQSIPKRIERGDEEVESLEPLGWEKFQNVIATDAIISGQWYARREDVGGAIVLERFLPSTIKYYYEQGKLHHFTRQTQAGPETWLADDPAFLWWWEDNFETTQGPGVSILFSALTDANLVNAGGKFSLAWYLRGGPITLLRAAANTQPGQVEKIEHWWNKITHGFRSWFKGVVIAADMLEPVLFGGDMKTGENEKTMRAAAERLAAALGVPLNMLFADFNARATAEQAERDLINYAAKPLAERIFTPLDEKIFNPAGAELNLYVEDMSAFSVRIGDQVDGLIKARDAKFITTGWAQAALNVPILPQKVVISKPQPAQLAAPVPVALNAPTPQRVELPAQTMAAQKDLEAWQRKAVNAIKRGKSPAVSFASDAIGALEHGRITAALGACATAEDVKAVFDGGEIDQLARANDLLERALQVLADGSK